MSKEETPTQETTPGNGFWGKIPTITSLIIAITGLLALFIHHHMRK
jgi:hypothetical protein